MVLTLVAIAALTCYATAAGLLAWSLTRGAAPAGYAWKPLALLALLGHGLILAQSLFPETGLNLTFYRALSLSAWFLAALHLLLGLWRPVASLGIVVFPIAGALLGLDLLLGQGRSVTLATEWQIRVHVFIAFVAYSVLSLAALQALMLALQEHALRRRQLDFVMRAFPPLTLMENYLFRLISAGFVLLSLTLLSGVLFVDNLFAQHLVHKTVLSILAWAVFGVLLWGRWRHGWRGRRAVRLTLAGMTVLVLAYFGSKFVLEVVLERVGSSL